VNIRVSLPFHPGMEGQRPPRNRPGPREGRLRLPPGARVLAVDVEVPAKLEPFARSSEVRRWARENAAARFPPVTRVEYPGVG
jgi:hypothetical protein